MSRYVINYVVEGNVRWSLMIKMTVSNYLPTIYSLRYYATFIHLKTVVSKNFQKFTCSSTSYSMGAIKIYSLLFLLSVVKRKSSCLWRIPFQFPHLTEKYSKYGKIFKPYTLFHNVVPG